MKRRWVTLVAIGPLISWSVFPSTAYAQVAQPEHAPAPLVPTGRMSPTSPGPPLGLIPVYIGGQNPEASYELWIDGQSRPFLGHCRGSCSAWVPRGHYSLLVEGPGLVTASSHVYLDTASELRVTPRSVAARNAGIVMALAGLGLATFGLGLTINDQVLRDPNKTGLARRTIGSFSLAAGAVLIPVGFLLARSAPAVETRPVWPGW